MTAASASSPLALLLRQAAALAGARVRRLLVVALLLSLVVHLAFTLWPVDVETPPEAAPLTATITELPPPPKVAAAAAPPPKPKPRRTAPVATPLPAPDEASPQGVAADASAEVPATPAEPAAAPAATAADADALVIPGAATTGKTLPPRVDLAYKVFYGTRGFLIGDAVYRFEHTGNRYRIATVGEARGLAALVLRGQGKIESRGLITDAGLQPLTFRVERGGPDRVESATFDWEAGTVTMRDDRTLALDMPTFDPLSLMWQYYFTPPADNVITFTIATARRLMRYTITREGMEQVEWSQGTLEAERWHRRSDDGKTDAYVWLAPSLRHLPVKMRVSNTDRGTIEVMLDAIRVDETGATVGRDDLPLARPPDSAAAAAVRKELVPDEYSGPAATFPTMTGQ